MNNITKKKKEYKKDQKWWAVRQKGVKAEANVPWKWEKKQQQQHRDTKTRVMWSKEKEKEKEKKKRKKFEKRENNQREHESSPRMSSQTETWFNFVLGVGWLTFFLAHLTFPGQSSLLLAEHCVLEASSVDLIYLSKLEYR